MTAPVYECEEGDREELIDEGELSWTQDGRDVCHDCFESGYDRDGYPIAQRDPDFSEGGAP